MDDNSLIRLISRGLNLGVDQDKDPRLGSTRDGSGNEGTLSTSSGSKSSSLKSLGSTFIPVVVYCVVCFLIFITLRRKCHRVYAPRTLRALRYPQKPSTPLPDGWFNWIKPFFNISDATILNNGSLDGFLFLRYLKVLRNIFLVGVCVTWCVLIPIHATGGNHGEQLDVLTIGNIAEAQRMYAHVFIAWAFFGFILFTIARESIYYINLRQAYLSSPKHAQRLSARTVLLTSVPPQYCSEPRLRKLYGDSVKRIWIPRTDKVLARLVKEREQTATRLEQAEVTLIKKANAARNKKLKKLKSDSNSTEGCTASQHTPELSNASSYSESCGSQTPRRIDITQQQQQQQCQLDDGNRTSDDQEHVVNQDAKKPVQQVDELSAISPQVSEKQSDDNDDTEYTHPYGLSPELPDVRGSVAALWIPVQARPHHRPIGNFLRRVDTIRWTRARIKDLNRQIYKMRQKVHHSGTALPAAFVEFHTQEAAQAAHQTVAHHRALQMSPRILGIRPDEVIWSSLRMKWWERIIRKFAINGLVTAAVIFWSIPSALIGVISNIGFLKNIFFLKWIGLLPAPILGFLQGFVPALALTLWMSLVPGMLRFCAIRAGTPSIVLVELFTQRAYFAFQVIQVFLVTTLTSAASAAFTKILKDPLSAKDLLAENLPKASNFYLSYILIQCLASGGNQLIHLLDLVRHYIFAKATVNPRTRFNIWYDMRQPKWGGVYPIFTNMAVITFSYSCIAPLILVFAAGGMAFVQLVYRYNLIFVLDSEIDSKGLFYPRALQQLIVGLYLAQICLVGLFVLKSAFIPMILMLIFTVFTALVQYTLSDAIEPLLHNLPQTLVLEEEIQEQEKMERERRQANADVDESATAGAANSYYDTNEVFGEDEQDQESSDDEGHQPNPSSRAVEGADSVRSALTEWLKSSAKEKVQTEVEKSGISKWFAKWNLLGNNDTNSSGAPPGFFRRWLHPEIHEDYLALRNIMAIDNDDMPNLDYLEDEAMHNYWPPELWLPKPHLWLPKDDARVSRQEVAHNKKFTPTTDGGAWLNEKGQIVIDDFGAAPFNKQRWMY